MIKKYGLAGLLLATLTITSCSKDDLELEWNNIVINDISTSYVQIDDCITSSGYTGTNFTFAIDFSNPDDETIKNLEFDLLYEDGSAFYSYNFTDFSVMGNVMNKDYCRAFFSNPYYDIRVFIVTEDDLRSKPKTYRLYNPE